MAVAAGRIEEEGMLGTIIIIVESIATATAAVVTRASFFHLYRFSEEKRVVFQDSHMYYYH